MMSSSHPFPYTSGQYCSRHMYAVLSYFSNRWVTKYSKVWDSARVSSARSFSTKGNLSNPWRRRKRERHETKGLMSKTIAVHVRYNSLYISLPSSVKQQREMTKFCVVYGTWTTTANFSYFHLELNAIVTSLA